MPGSMCAWGLFKFESCIDEFGKVFSFEEFGKADADLRHVFFWPIWGEVDCVITPLPMGKRTHCNHP